MITRKDIEKLNRIRKEKRRIEKLEKALTAELLGKATETEHNWKGLSYKIIDAVNTSPNREKINALPNWEEYYNKTPYQKITIDA